MNVIYIGFFLCFFLDFLLEHTHSVLLCSIEFDIRLQSIFFFVTIFRGLFGSSAMAQKLSASHRD